MPVDLHVDDAGFVRAPAPLVYRRLTNVGAWPRWWRGVRVEARPSEPEAQIWAIELPGGALRRLRVLLRVHGWRHDAGFSLQLDGDVQGRAEFWLEPSGGGTVVHHLAVLTTPLPHPQRVLADYRRGLRRGLWGLKDALQVEARSSAGLLP